MAKVNNNGNGAVRKVSLAVTIVVIIITSAITIGMVLATQGEQGRCIERLEAEKVDKAVHNECIGSIKEDVKEIKAEQGEMNGKLDQILQKL